MRCLLNGKGGQPALGLVLTGAVLLLVAAGCKARSSAPQSSQATNVPAPASSSPSAAFKEGRQKIGEGAQEIGQAVAKTAVKTWDSVKVGVGKAGEEIKTGAQKTGDAIKDTSQKIGDQFKSSQ